MVPATDPEADPRRGGPLFMRRFGAAVPPDPDRMEPGACGWLQNPLSPVPHNWWDARRVRARTLRHIQDTCKAMTTTLRTTRQK